MDNEKIIEELTKKLDEKQAKDIKVLDIKTISDFADYFVICSANNPNQLRTLVDTTEEVLSKLKVEYAIEGRDNSGWILIDCIDIIIHIFAADEREFYNLEHMWQDGNFIDIEKFLPTRDV